MIRGIGNLMATSNIQLLIPARIASIGRNVGGDFCVQPLQKADHQIGDSCHHLAASGVKILCSINAVMFC